MVEVTQADRNAAKNMDRQNLLGCYLEEHIDRGDYDHVPAIQQFANHRIEAAKAERGRLRELSDDVVFDVWYKLRAERFTTIPEDDIRFIATALADALESQP